MVASLENLKEELQAASNTYINVCGYVCLTRRVTTNTLMTT
jgi:hypothetical protein